MRGSTLFIRCRRALLVALFTLGAALSTASYAGDGYYRGHHAKHRDHGRHWHDRQHRDRRHARRDHHRHERRDYRQRYEHRDGRRGHYGSDWHYHRGRYWAPPRYRGRYCEDRRHHRGGHYHVAVHDYYDYYYPRYRASYPHDGGYGANASVIISIPLF